MNMTIDSRPDGTAVDYDPFAQPALARVVPSTEAQREIWLAAKLGTDATLAYNEAAALHLGGPLDHAALVAALDAVVDRHDALRATFSPDGQSLCIAARAAPALTEHPQADDARVLLDARLAAIVQQPFDLEHGPLLRAEIVPLDATHHVLLLCAHHAVCDGWSWWVLVRELGALYGQHAGVAAAPLPAAPAFADYAQALTAPEAQRAVAADVAWWAHQYRVLPPPLDLPTDRPRPATRSFAADRLDVTLDAGLVAAFRKLAAHHGTSLFAALLGSFAALLARLAAQDDVVLGIPAAAQANEGLGDLVGHGVNLLPLRFRLDAAAPFTHLLDGARDGLLDAMEHQRCTLGRLVRELDLPRDAARLPLASVLFNIDQALEHEDHAFAGLDLAFASVPRRYENFELFINAVQERGALRLECQYNTDLFDAATVRRWLHAYATLLRAAVAAPDTALGKLALNDAQALRELAALQPPATSFDPPTTTLQAAFERQAQATPERIALRAGEQVLSYRQLDEQANRVAHGLRAHGVGAGALVGVALERGPLMLVATLGALKAGAGYVPLDPGFPAERLAYMAEDAKLAALLTQRSLAGRFTLPGVATFALDAPPAEWSALPVTRPQVTIEPDAIAYVIYTSGSTGKPKGVAIPHAAVANFLASMAQRPGLVADDCLLAVTTLSFDIAVLELYGPLGVGACVVLATHAQAMDGEALQELLATQSITVMQATPASWRLLLQSGWQGSATLRALCGGEALAPDLAAALLPRVAALWNLYGPTETTVWSTCAQVAAGQPIHIGTPIANTTVWVLDAQRQPCPLGVPGELWIGGAGVALGYLHRADLTAERFMADPFRSDPGARLYRTGDRGCWHADGTLEHLGRVDFQIKLRGFRIEPGEIEARLVAHAGVRQALVMAREDRPGDVRLVAYVVPRDAQVSPASVRAALRGRLPDYMLPQHVVVLDAFPQTPNGKVDRARLPAPAGTAPEAVPVDAAPRDELEATLAQHMAEVLGAGQVGRNDDFFALGGHSLLAAQWIARINRSCAVALTLRSAFEAPTVARLAVLVRQARQAGVVAQDSIPRRADRARAPLSLQQQRVWYLEQMHPGTVAWHTPSAHRLRGDLDLPAFEQALQWMVQRQAVLRTAIEADGEGVWQRVLPALTVTLTCEDLSGVAQGERENRLRQRLDALIAEPFDLAVAPLFRMRLFRLAPQEHVFFFMAHHAIWDGWSFDLLYRELGALYAACLAGAASPLAPLAIEYGDYAAWQRGYLSGDELQRQSAPWLARLANPPMPLVLPTDHPRPPQMSGRGATEWVRIGADRLAAVHMLARRMETTPFVVLLAAFAALLQRLSGQRDLIISTPVRNRHAVELEAVMGFFVNALPLRLTPDPAQPFTALVALARGVVLDAFASPDVPFEHLVRALHLPHDDSRPPLAQAMFSFQDVRGRVTTWGGLKQEHLPVFQRGSADDLGLWFIEQDDGLLGGMSFNADIFEPATAARFRRQFETLLATLVAAPDTALADLPLDAPDSASAASPATVDSAPAPAAGTAAPAGLADPREAQLARIWQDLIGVDGIQATDNFFDLGGHSLLAVEMVTRVQRETGTRLNLIDIATGTLGTLAVSLPLPGSAPGAPGLARRLRGWLGWHAG